MNACGACDFRAEAAVLLQRACPREGDAADDGAVDAVETQGDGSATGGGCRQLESFGARAEVHATQADVLAVVEVSDIHILTPS